MKLACNANPFSNYIKCIWISLGTHPMLSFGKRLYLDAVINPWV